MLAPQVERASGGRLRMVDPSGSVWHGSAHLVDARGRTRLPVAWRLDPVSMLRGTPHAVLERTGPGPGIGAELTWRGDAIEARALDATLPASMVAPAAGVNVGGEINATSERMSVGRTAHEGSVRLEWPRARLELPAAGALDLGTVTATLTAEQARWRGPLQARGGAIHADGEASVDANGADIDLTIVPQPGLPAGVRQALKAPDGTGTLRLRLAPRFR
jgi:general secretion pathway protein N